MDKDSRDPHASRIFPLHFRFAAGISSDILLSAAVCCGIMVSGTSMKIEEGRKMSRLCSACFSIVLTLSLTGPAPCEQVPGVVINYLPSSSQVYIGSPGIGILANGDYLAKHDEFGPRSTERGNAVTQVFRSTDRGRTWSHATTVTGMYWASLFVHRDNAYLIGTSRYHGDVVISRSSDGGTTWTVPKDGSSGVLLEGAKYHCAPVPIVVH